MTYSIFHSTRALETFLEIIAVLSLIVAWLCPAAARRRMTRAEQRFTKLAANRPKAIALAAAVPLVIRFLLLPVFPVPQPRVHDEFSYLLLGDTLAHGRAANPALPYQEHFETEYELVKPTYASQYQPAQGLVLAAGQLILRNAWWGVWLSVGLMCGALCWALGLAVPPRWALFGSLLAALQFGIFGFWMNSYFGGAVPALGGALAFGGLMVRRNALFAAISSTGLVIVLASRPAEGVLWLLVSMAVMARHRAGGRAFLAFFLVLAAGLGGLAFYNSRVTGDPLKSPYAVYRHDYGTPQSYWWQPAVVVDHFDNSELAANYEDQLRYWKRRYSAGALWDSTWHRVRDFWRFFLGPFLTPAFLFAGCAVTRRRKLRPWLWISGLFILDHATYHAWYPQQSASETILIMMLVVEGWRQMRIWRRRTGTGIAFSRNLTAGFAVAATVLIAGLAVMPAAGRTRAGFPRIWDTMAAEPNARETAIGKLKSLPGKHLVFVHYGPHHPWYDEWVFNDADLKESRIVFARMVTPESDLALARSLGDRDVWIASPEEGPLVARVTVAELLVASARH